MRSVATRGLLAHFLVCVLASAGLALGGARLVLEDGQELEGVEVERKDDYYLLELDTGNVLPVPVELVSRMELTGEDAPPATGLVAGEGETLVGPPDWERPPQRSEQTANLGSPSRFRRGPIDPTWVPESDWDMSLSNNNFNPSRWYRPPIDPEWRPRSVFTAADDVTEFNPVRWYQAPIDSTWWPEEGFRQRSD